MTIKKEFLCSSDRDRYRNGQAAFIAVFFLVLISLGVITGFSLLALRESDIVRIRINAAESYFLAEAGVEDVFVRMTKGMPYSVEEQVALAGGRATTAVGYDAATQITTISAEGNASQSIRKVAINLAPSSKKVSFVYGVQVGAGGLSMGNGTVIEGNIYSNGDIHGSGAGASTITGTAIAAGNHIIEDVTVSQNASADRFDDCAVAGTATYFSQWTSCTGTAQVGSTPPPVASYPLSDAQIMDWKSTAEAGGTQGTVTIGNGESMTLGPKKIAGDINFGNNGVLTLTGTVWVTGSINFGNNDTLQLSSSYGILSGIVIVDGQVTIGNNVVLHGSGTSGSYLMLLDSYTGAGDAITVNNNTTGAILYAPDDFISIGNNLNLREAVGYGLILGNNSTVTYEAGLASSNFSSGPSGGYDVKSWKEIE